MVQNDDHTCSRKTEFHVVEDKTIPERHETSNLEANLTSQTSTICDEVPATKLPKSEDFIPVADKTAVKKVNESKTLDKSKEFTTVMKRVTKMEEKIAYMNNQPSTMPPEDEMLNAALSRAHVLEQELQATKKALEDSRAKQEQLFAYMEKKKKKKKWFPW